MTTSPNQPEKPGISDIMQGIYGRHTTEEWSRLESDHPDMSQEQIVRMLENEPTCNYSFFLREPNLEAVPLLLETEKTGYPKILSVGCGSGPEPYEIAMRMIKSGFRNFSVCGIDTSKESIASADNGIITLQDEGLLINDRARYLMEMESAGLLEPSNHRNTKGRREREWSLSATVASKLKFECFDIIDKPYAPGLKFDLIVCNNVLYHYPIGTRELMLQHLLESMADGGKLVLEKEERDQYGGSADRMAWLYPYYDWKKVLGYFGLNPKKYPEETWMFKNNYYMYDESKNKCYGKRYVIRDGKMVEMP